VDAARKARRLLLRMRKKTNEGQLACPRGYEETLRTLAAAGRAKDALEVMLWMREDAVTPESRHLAYAAVALSRACAAADDSDPASRLFWSEKCTALLKEISQRIDAESESAKGLNQGTRRRRRKRTVPLPFASAADLAAVVRCAALTAHGADELLPMVQRLGWRDAGITSLIKTLGSVSRPDEVMSLLKALERDSTNLNLVHINAAMHQLNRNARHSDSLAIFKRLLYNGGDGRGSAKLPKPDVFSFAAGATACEGAIDTMLDIPQIMRDMNIKANVKVYGALIGACARGGKWEQAAMLLKAMWEDDAVEPDSSAVCAAASACTRAGEPLLSLVLLQPLLPEAAVWAEAEHLTSRSDNSVLSNVGIDISKIPIRSAAGAEQEVHKQILCALNEHGEFAVSLRHYETLLSSSIWKNESLRYHGSIAAAHLGLYESAFTYAGFSRESLKTQRGAPLIRTAASLANIAAAQRDWDVVDELTHPDTLSAMDESGCRAVDARRMYEAAISSARMKKKYGQVTMLFRKFQRKHGQEAFSAGMRHHAAVSYRALRQDNMATALEDGLLK
jgi:pentatricopeptide repeat protein